MAHLLQTSNVYPLSSPPLAATQHFDAVSNSIWPALSHHCLLEIIYGLKINCALSNYSDSACNMLQQHYVWMLFGELPRQQHVAVFISSYVSLMRSCGRRLLGVLGVARWAYAPKQRSQYRKSN